MLHIQSLEGFKEKDIYIDRLFFHKVERSDLINVLNATLMNLSPINFVLLTMLKVREEQIHFWFCWCFSPTGPMHLISALSLSVGTLWTKPEGVLQVPDSTKWRTWIYEHTHTEQDIANTALQTAGHTKNMGDSISRGADVKVHTQSNDAPKGWKRWEVLSRRLKTLDPCRRRSRSLSQVAFPDQ